MGERFIHLPPRRSFGAFVKIAKLFGVELEEVESVHPEPLVHESTHELACLRLVEEAFHFALQTVRVGEIR